MMLDVHIVVTQWH